jgi:hypothetical protein
MASSTAIVSQLLRSLRNLATSAHTGLEAKRSAHPPGEDSKEVQPRHHWLTVYPFEVVAWLGLLTAVIFLRSNGLRIDWVTFNYTIPPLVPVIAKAFAVGVVAQAVYAQFYRRDLATYLREITTVRWLVLSLRVWIAVLLFNYIYFWLKVCVPLVNQRLWDEALLNLDSAVHLGYSPSVFLTELMSGTVMLRGLDLWYGWWLPTISYSVAFFCASASASIRRPFVLSCVLIWVVGAWLYVAIPALGPAYVSSEVWAEVRDELPSAQSGQQLLWENYSVVVAGRSGGLKQFNPTRGIAAMPSLHVGVHWLLLLWVRKHLRPFYLLAIVACVLTFLGSIVTGWHYAIDGYVGILLAHLVYWISQRSEAARRTPTQAAATS